MNEIHSGEKCGEFFVPQRIIPQLPGGSRWHFHFLVFANVSHRRKASMHASKEKKKEENGWSSVRYLGDYLIYHHSSKSKDMESSRKEISPPYRLSGLSSSGSKIDRNKRSSATSLFSRWYSGSALRTTLSKAGRYPRI